MVDPFGHQTARLVNRRFGMVDAVKGRASAEGVHVPITVNHQFPVSGHNRTLTTTSDGAYVTRHPETAPLALPRASARLTDASNDRLI
jgi:hypothetical protein